MQAIVATRSSWRNLVCAIASETQQAASLPIIFGMFKGLAEHLDSRQDIGVTGVSILAPFGLLGLILFPGESLGLPVRGFWPR